MRKSTMRSKLVALTITLCVTLLTSCGVQVQTTSDVAQPTPQQASLLLTQATFGPSAEEINRLQNMGTAAWFNEQFAKPQTKHFDYVSPAVANLPSGTTADQTPFLQSFWQKAITGDDQLRQRVAYALSQIFVISFQNATLANMPRGVASYYDMLGTYAFGNFRDLLQAVTLHPMMGIYLSSLANQSSNGTAREPDQNYAREVMQLFTIGLEQLNADGSDSGNPTYTNADIVSLANVFTGWSWAGPDKSKNRFLSSPTSAPSSSVDPNRDWLPMQNYSSSSAPYHETGDITFPPGSTLNIPTIPAGTTGEDSLKIVLDALFNNNNVPYFIGRQLIQRLVTSNPSTTYVNFVADAFKAPPRGDMKAVIKAVLLYPVLNPTLVNPTGNSTGKLREPVIRLANWMRAFHVTSASGIFPIANLDNTSNALGQTPMNSPTVFNFYRPDYQPPGSNLASNSLASPEMQITEETSVFGYLNFMKGVITNGAGTGNDVKADYTNELALAATPDQLIERINLLLMQSNMSTYLKSQISTAVATIPKDANYAKNAVYLTIFLTMASPEYLVLK